MKPTRSAHKKFVCAGLLLSLGALSTPAQPACPTYAWSLSYGGPFSATEMLCSTDIAYDVATDNDGNIVVAGFECRPDLGLGRVWLVQKYDSTGNIQWTYTTGGSNDRAHGVAFDSLGNVIAAGNDGGDWLVHKYDPSGTLLWSRTYNGTNGLQGAANAVVTDSNRNVIAVGVRGGCNECRGADWFIQKYSSDGNVLWFRTYAGLPSSPDAAYGVAIDSSENIFVAGNSMDNALNFFWLIRKYDSVGNVLWSRTYHSSAVGSEEARAVAVDKGGNVVVVGWEYRPDLSEGLNWVIRKYDSSGNLLWHQTYNGVASKDDKAHGVAINDCGNIVVSGFVDAVDASGLDADFGEGDMHMRVYNSSGVFECEYTYSSPGMDGDGALDVALDKNGNAIIVGYENRYDLDQGINWLVRSYSGLSCLEPILLIEPPITKPPIDPVYVDDFEKIKIMGGIQGYINPSRGEASVILIKPDEPGEVHVRIYDLTGALVWQRTFMAAGNQMEIVQWPGVDESGNEVSPGIYPVFIEAPGIRYKDKIIVVR